MRKVCGDIRHVITTRQLGVESPRGQGYNYHASVQQDRLSFAFTVMSSPSKHLTDGSLEPPPTKQAHAQSNGAALANPHLSTMDDDFLYHIGYSRHEIRETFHDVKVIQMKIWISNLIFFYVIYLKYFGVQHFFTAVM